jgi:hypothetical protein
LDVNKFTSKNKLLINRFINNPDKRSKTQEVNKIKKMDSVSTPRNNSKIQIGNLSAERSRDKPEINDTTSNNVSQTISKYS